MGAAFRTSTRAKCKTELYSLQIVGHGVKLRRDPARHVSRIALGIEISPFRAAANGAEVEALDFVPRPLGLAQKLQAGFDGWVAVKAIDVDSSTQLAPAVFLDQVFQHAD